ncbi:MAG: GFA family protein [Steroidobacteraceae bacterium]|nr:GFA family protein [Steroidobacteraceae bacterium]
MAIQAACLCGTVRYEIEGPFSSMLNCHCSMCRKHHGAPFATFAAAALEGFRWLSGEEKLTHYKSSPNGTRSFCSVCGSVAPLLMRDAGTVLVPAGPLEGDPGIRPQGHMFVGSKAPWYTISDSLPQHEAYPPECGDVPSIPRPTVSAEPGKTIGSCLCGDVAYEITSAPLAMYQCHCSRCRRARSAAHGANLFYKLADFHWTRGSSQVVSYKVPEAKRFTVAFCRRCGASVPQESPTLGGVVVPAGGLDTDPGMRPMAHIFVNSKAVWFDITDTMPQIPEAPPLPTAR